jgi:putative tricarboxylic transport membrane protein
VAAGPAAQLFNAPPRFTVDTATGQVNNLHNLMNHWEFLGYGLLAVLIASLVSYPFAMNYAHKAAAFVSRKLSHEAIIGTFMGIKARISPADDRRYSAKRCDRPQEDKDGYCRAAVD